MAADLSPADRLLIMAVSQADVMDAAGRLIANPRRAVVSLGEQVAMAIAVERLQAVAIEAELLVNALEATTPWGAIDPDISAQIAVVRMHIAAARAETNTDEQETEDGSGHS